MLQEATTTINNGEATISKPVLGTDDNTEFGGGGSSGGGSGSSSSSSTGRTFTMSFKIIDSNGDTASVGSIQLILTYTDVNGQSKTVSTERYTGNSASGYQYGVLRISTSKTYQNTDILLTVYVNGQKKYDETLQFQSDGLAWSTSDSSRFSSYTLYLVVPSIAHGIILPSIYRPFYSQGTIVIDPGNTLEANFAIANGITYQMADKNFYLGDTVLSIDGSGITADKTWVTADASGDATGPESDEELTGNTVQILWNTGIDNLNRGAWDQTKDDWTLTGGWYGFKVWYRTSSSFDISGVKANIKVKSGTKHFNTGDIDGEVAAEALSKATETTVTDYAIGKSTEWVLIIGSSEDDNDFTMVDGNITVNLSTPDGYTATTRSTNAEMITTYTNGDSESGSGDSYDDVESQTLTGDTLYRMYNELYQNTVITCKQTLFKDGNFSLGKSHSCSLEVTEGSPAGYTGTIVPKTIGVYNSNMRFYESIKLNGKVGTVKETVTEDGAEKEITHMSFVCDVSGKTSGVRYFAVPTYAINDICGSVSEFLKKAKTITPLDYAYEESASWHSIHTVIGQYSLYQRELVEYYDSSLSSNQIRVKTVGYIGDLIMGDITIIGISDAFTDLSGNGIESGTEYYDECRNPYNEIVPHTSFMSFIKIY